MNTFTSIGLCVLMAAMLTPGIRSVVANAEPEANPSTAEDHEEAPVNDDAHLQQSTLLNARHAGSLHVLPHKPFRSMLASELIGRSLTFHQDREFGAIEDFIFDEHGQILAIIVGADGFLGMGERKVAIPWHDVERGLNVEGEATFQVDTTEEGLRNAPDYAPE